MSRFKPKLQFPRTPQDDYQIALGDDYERWRVANSVFGCNITETILASRKRSLDGFRRIETYVEPDPEKVALMQQLYDDLEPSEKARLKLLLDRT